jgi:hypothetical protein
MAGVEPVVGVSGVYDIDILGKKIVEPVDELLHGQGPRRLEVGNLPDRVHAGVGSPGPLEIDRDAKQLAGSPQQVTLNGPGVQLPLPPVVAGSLVLDRGGSACSKNT